MRTATILRTLAMIAIGVHQANPYMTTADTTTTAIITGKTSDCLAMHDNNFKDNSCNSSNVAMPYMYITFSKPTAVASVILAIDKDGLTFPY
jgi:hypothetical protein